VQIGATFEPDHPHVSAAAASVMTAAMKIAVSVGDSVHIGVTSVHLAPLRGRGAFLGDVGERSKERDRVRARRRIPETDVEQFRRNHLRCAATVAARAADAAHRQRAERNFDLNAGFVTG
jgi:hypothetical protein